MQMNHDVNHSLKFTYAGESLMLTVADDVRVKTSRRYTYRKYECAVTAA